MAKSQKQTTKNILVVDDTPDNLRLLSEMLKEQGYRIRVAQNGARALATVQIELPDLILLDISMPDMDGFEVCQQLKANEQTRDIPIIFISARDETKDKVKGFTMGGVDYITKPFQVEEVLARVKTHLTIRNLQRQLHEKIIQLQEALDKVKTLRGFIPICANCKKVREDEGFWKQVEVYVSEHSEAQFSHSICPDCLKELYPEFHETSDKL